MTISKPYRIPILLLLITELFLLFLFPPSLLFTPDVTAGGDTPSHFISAMAMRHNLLSFFSPVTWIPGNYAGFPLFLNYFPLPFLLMALLALVIPLQVAFKLVTLLAVIPLPAAIFYSLRRLGYKEHVPALGALLALPFLFMTENSMWGGNIPSTLAGEFAFGISFILSIIFMGRMYGDAPKNKSIFTNSILEALIALSNGYPLLQAGTGTSFFLLRGGCTRYVLCIHAIAFSLSGFWIVPLIWRLPWNSPFVHTWHFQGWSEICPRVLWPSIAGALIGLSGHFRNRPLKFRNIRSFLRADTAFGPEQYLWWQLGIALAGFSLAPLLGLVDIRFLPFAQITMAMLGAIGWGKLISRLPRPSLWTIGFAAAVIVISLSKAPMVDSWIRWNYSGMQSKPLAKSFLQVNDFLKGTENSPRVVYEHSQIHDGAGTVRAFELLPYFSGRSTLEGLYMQSSVSSPFVFYIQSELAQSPSAPYGNDYYSRPDPERAMKHLSLFNVNQIIAVSDNTCNSLDQSPAYELQTTIPPFKVYGLVNSANNYVTPVHFSPFRIPERNWKTVQFNWFRKSSIEVPLVVTSPGMPGDFWKKLPVLEGPVDDIPRIPILDSNEPEPIARAELAENRITITTTRPGHPLWIKISYHPDWRISAGEGELYLASPAFMLLVPKSHKVTLEFDTRHGIYLLGKMVSLLALTLCIGIPLALRLSRKNEDKSSPDAPSTKSPSLLSSIFPPNAWIVVSSFALAVLILGAAVTRNHRDPLLLYALAHEKYEEAEDIGREITAGLANPNAASEKEKLMLQAFALSDECIAKYADTSIYDHSIFIKTKVLSDEKRWAEVRGILEDFLKSHPDTRIAADARFMLADAYSNLGEKDKAEQSFWGSLLAWPSTNAGVQAGLRLTETLGPATLQEKAKSAFDLENYLEAYVIFRALTFHADEQIRSESSLCLAYCCYRLSRWEESANLFLQWLSSHFESPGSKEAEKTLLQCQTIINLNKEWQTPPEQASGARTLYQYLTGRP
jgi:tetratricopeptide (TPR) repeat protein